MSLSNKKLFVFGVLIAMAISLVAPTAAYAGVSGSDGNGGNWQGDGSGNSYAALGSVQWKNLNSEIRSDIYNAGYHDVLNAQVGQYVAMPWYDSRPKYGFKAGAWFRWPTINRLWQISADMLNPNQGLDGRLITHMRDKGYSIQTHYRDTNAGGVYNRNSIKWWWNSDAGEFADAVWISERVVEKEFPDEFITYTTDDNETPVDDRDKSGEWLWHNGKKESSYHDKTDPVEHNYKNNIHAEITTVVKHEKHFQRIDENGNWYDYKDPEIWYEKTNVKNFDKTITYKDNAPTLTQEKYVPFNLNRNGYATAEDISAEYANANKKLSATVDNQQGITDNKEINALDINSNTDFTFKFNSPFGMPDSYNWTNNPDALTNGVWEYANGKEYANGHNNGADSDGRLRYGLRFQASISTNTKDGSKSSSSLVTPNGDEIVSNESFSSSYQGEGSFSGGEWSSKFTMNDNYTTDNHVDDEFKQWWVNQYSQGRFFEYGTEYWGKITTSGIENPYKVSHGTGAADGGNYHISIDANKDQRGIYVELASTKFTQPVLYGKWKVKTVAGDIN